MQFAVLKFPILQNSYRTFESEPVDLIGQMKHKVF